MEPVCSKVVVCEIPNFLQGCLLNPINKSQCSYNLETTQLICCVNQLNGFQMMETAPLGMLSSVLTYQSSCFRQFDWTQGTCLVTTHSLSKKFFDANLIDLFCKYYILNILYVYMQFYRCCQKVYIEKNTCKKYIIKVKIIEINDRCYSGIQIPDNGFNSSQMTYVYLEHCQLNIYDEHFLPKQ